MLWLIINNKYHDLFLEFIEGMLTHILQYRNPTKE
jgi:hypothetical protein